MLERVSVIGKGFREQTKTAQTDLSFYSKEKHPEIMVFDKNGERKPYVFDTKFLNGYEISYLWPKILRNPSILNPEPIHIPLPEINESSTVFVPKDPEVFEGTFKEAGSNFNEVRSNYEKPHWLEYWMKLEPYLILIGAIRNRQNTRITTSSERLISVKII